MKVGPDQLSRPPQQGKARESNDRRRNQCPGGCIADRPQEYLPANRTYYVSQIDESHRVQNVMQAEVVSLAPECGPVEISPGAELKVDEKKKDAEQRAKDEKAFFIHLSASTGTLQIRTAPCQGK